jgi:glycosyltransferase involved in cell wall biosynthesis
LSETTVSGSPNSSAGNESRTPTSPRVLLSHPTGNQNVRNALRSFYEHGMLAEFWTTLAWNPESKWNRILPSGVRNQLAKRAFLEAPDERVKCVPWKEIVRLGLRDSFLHSILCSGERPFSINGMYRHFDGNVARRVRQAGLDAVFAYEGGARDTFREAEQRGVAALYELPSSHWHWEHRLLSEEAERNPAYANLLPKLKDSPGHMQWKDEELGLADFVFVPSEHVRKTLQGVVPDDRIRVVNYGAPPVRPHQPVSMDASRPLRVLFVGALSQRKGIGYLLDAVEMLDSRVELTLVGGRIAGNPRVDAACGRWRWFPSLSQVEVLGRMREADILVLPSLAEGCALVVLEALACGLPVVVTPNTGALEFVRDGAEGFVVPIRCSDAIADRLSRLDGDRELLAVMSRNAQETAAEKSWERYRQNLADTVGAVLCR